MEDSKTSFYNWHLFPPTHYLKSLACDIFPSDSPECCSQVPWYISEITQGQRIYMNSGILQLDSISLK